jgi:hypothetical protein
MGARIPSTFKHKDSRQEWEEYSVAQVVVVAPYRPKQRRESNNDRANPQEIDFRKPWERTKGCATRRRQIHARTLISERADRGKAVVPEIGRCQAQTG